MKLKSATFWTFCLTAGLHFGVLTGGPLPAGAAGPPNVLFITVDDLRPAIGAYGDPIARTPNIDRLAKQGRIFSRAYTQQAVCAPSRAAVLTGLLPDRTGIWDLRTPVREAMPDVVTLPQYFKQNGYGTHGYGKIFHNAQHEDPNSWTIPNQSASPLKRRYAAPKNLTGRLKEDPVERLETVDEAYADGIVAVQAVEAMRHVPEPFFMAVGFQKPHLPFTAPRRYWDQYDRASFAVPEDQQRSGTRRGPEGTPEMAFPRHSELAGYNGIPDDLHLSEEQVKELRHGYYACVTFIDTLIGRLLDALEERGAADNTVIVLWGDHGFHLGENQYWAKSTNFELDTRIPLIIAAPGMEQAGAAAGGLVEAIDIYPTLVEIAGLPVRPDLDGVSLAPLLANPDAEIRDHAMSQFPRPWFYPRGGSPDAMGYSIRTADFRYTAWLDFETREVVEQELYEYVSSGVAESKNLAGNQAYVPVQREMGRKLRTILRERIGADAWP